MENLLKGLTIKKFLGFESGYRCRKNESECVVSGFCIEYTNGFKTFSGGGASSGYDYNELILVDDKNIVIDSLEKLVLF